MKQFLTALGLGLHPGIGRIELVTHEFQPVGHVILEILALHNGVQHAVLQEKLATLKALGQLLADGLFNHTGPGESDQCSRFGDVDITQHRKAGRDSPGRRIGQEGNVGKPG